MSVRRAAVLALLLTALAGCDRLTGAADRQVADAEAIGFACRVSMKSPEDCMKENDTYSPSYILDGWKLADADIKAGKLDPDMRGGKSTMAQEGTAEAAEAAADTADTEAAAAPAAPQPQPETAPAGS